MLMNNLDTTLIIISVSYTHLAYGKGIRETRIIRVYAEYDYVHIRRDILAGYRRSISYIF